MFFHTWCMGYFCVWKVFLSYKLPSAQCSCTIYRNQDACWILKFTHPIGKSNTILFFCTDSHCSTLSSIIPASLGSTYKWNHAVFLSEFALQGFMGLPPVSVWLSQISAVVSFISACSEQWFDEDGTGVLSSTNWSHFLWMRTHPKVGLQHHMLVLPWMFWDIP